MSSRKPLKEAERPKERRRGGLNFALSSGFNIVDRKERSIIVLDSDDETPQSDSKLSSKPSSVAGSSYESVRDMQSLICFSVKRSRPSVATSYQGPNDVIELSDSDDVKAPPPPTGPPSKSGSAQPKPSSSKERVYIEIFDSDEEPSVIVPPPVSGTESSSTIRNLTQAPIAGQEASGSPTADISADGSDLEGILEDLSGPAYQGEIFNPDSPLMENEEFPLSDAPGDVWAATGSTEVEYELVQEPMRRYSASASPIPHQPTSADVEEEQNAAPSFGLDSEDDAMDLDIADLQDQLQSPDDKVESTVGRKPRAHQKLLGVRNRNLRLNRRNQVHLVGFVVLHSPSSLTQSLSDFSKEMRNR